jgi:macrolide-specific efflux system membrane fusion protein
MALGQGLPDPIFIVPTKIESCSLQESLEIVGSVETPVHSVLRAGWSLKIEKIHVVRGQKVKKGDLLVSADPGFFKQQIGFYERQTQILSKSLSNYRADLRSLRDREERLRGLVEKDISPRSQLEELERSIASITTELQRIEKTRGDLESELKIAKTRADKSNFYSPVDGVVTQIIADPRALSGSLVAHFNTVIARVDSPGRYVVKAQVLDFQVSRLKKGQKANVRLPHGEVISGVVDFVAPVPVPVEAPQNPWSQVAQNQTSRFAVWVRFDRPGPIIAADTSAHVNVNLAQHSAKVCAPVNALRVDRGSSTIALRQSKGGWKLVPVQTGRMDHARVEILAGAKPGDTVAASLW